MEFSGPERPTVLVSNDDGIDAPGLRALLVALHTADFARVLVCAPDSERHDLCQIHCCSAPQHIVSKAHVQGELMHTKARRSAQSHAITLTRELQCSERQLPGKPAKRRDCCLRALSGN